MEQVIWFAAGFFACLSVVPLLMGVAWLVDKNLEMECHRCGRCFGQIGETYVRATLLQFRWHRWTGACKRKAEHAKAE